MRALVTPTEHGITSRVLAKAAVGNLTLFAFAAGQGLTTHSSPFEGLGNSPSAAEFSRGNRF